jgi:hypothetical protein
MKVSWLSSRKASRKIGAVYLIRSVGHGEGQRPVIQWGQAFPDACNVGELAYTFSNGKWHAGKELTSTSKLSKVRENNG